MIRTLRSLVALLAALGLIVVAGSAFAAPADKDKGQAPAEQKKNTKPSGEKKQHKHFSGKDLVGDKVKKDGTSKFHENGKYSAFVNVSKGKITGVNVKHADKGDVAVTKYKTNKKMAARPASGIQLASFDLVQYQDLGTVWIGFGYIDEWGDENIYWFPYDMVYDGFTGAIEYYPV